MRAVYSTAVLGLVLLFSLMVGGCVNPEVDVQRGQITSSPSGAKVYLYEDFSGRTEMLGETPFNLELQQGLPRVRLIIEKEGYEKQRWVIPRSGSVSHHFELEKVETAEE